MNVSCPQCKTRYSVDDSRIPPSGVSIKCPKCSHTFVAKKEQAAAVAGGPGAVALPGSVAAKAAAPDRASSAVALPGTVSPPKAKIPPATTDSGLDSDLDLGLDDDMPAPKSKPAAPAGGGGQAKSFSEAGVLDFIDDTKKKPGGAPSAAGASHEYKVRRRNGRVEGPFGLGRIVAMLKAKDFTGGEDISEDGVSWRAMTSHPELNKAINEIMASDDLELGSAPPSKAKASSQLDDLDMGDDEPPAAPPPRAPPPGGPMADALGDDLDLDVPDPDGGKPAKSAPGPRGTSGDRPPRGEGGEDLQVGEIPEMPPLWTTYKKPILVFGGVMALVLFGVFTHLFSPWGAFLVPGLIAELSKKPPPPPPEKPPPPPAKLVSPEEVAKLISEGSYEAFRSVFATIQSAGPDLPDNMLAMAKARGMATLAYGSEVFPQSDLVKAVEALNTLDLTKAMGGNAAAANVEILKARSALEISAGSHESAATQLSALLEQRPDDEELALLLGLARFKAGDAKGALEALDKALVADPHYALAIHAIGDVVASLGEGSQEDAAFWYAKALRAQPAHSRSGVAAAKIYAALHREGARRRVLFDTAAEVERGLQPAERPGVLYAAAKAFDDIRLIRAAASHAQAAARLDPTNASYVALAAVASANTGQVESAIQDLDKQIQRNPGDVDALLARARAHFRNDDVAKAFLDLENASKTAPQNPWPTIWESRFNFLLGKFSDTRKGLERAVRVDRTATSMVELGRLELSLGDVDQALKRAHEAVKIEPTSAKAQALLGDCLAQRAEFKEALDTYRKALDYDDESLEARLGYANALREIASRQPQPRLANELAAAIPLYLAALAEQPDNPQVLFEYGRGLELEGKLQAALALYREAAQLDEKDVRPHLRMAQAFIEADKPDLTEAKASLARAQQIELSSGRQFAEVHYWEARHAMAENRVHDAVSAMKLAVEMEPRSALYHYWLGRVLERNNSLYEAITYYEKAVSLNSRYAEAHRALGWAAIERHKFDDARESFGRFMEAAPEDKTIFLDIGESYVRQNKDKEALEAFQKMVQAHPTNAPALVQIGNIMSRKGEDNDALKFFQRAVKGDPDFGEGVCQLGIVLSRVKVTKEAQGHLCRCLTLKSAPEDMKQTAKDILDTAGADC